MTDAVHTSEVLGIVGDPSISRSRGRLLSDQAAMPRYYLSMLIIQWVPAQTFQFPMHHFALYLCSDSVFSVRWMEPFLSRSDLGWPDRV